jgi:hypothetical protein
VSLGQSPLTPFHERYRKKQAERHGSVPGRFLDVVNHEEFARPLGASNRRAPRRAARGSIRSPHCGRSEEGESIEGEGRLNVIYLPRVFMSCSDKEVQNGWYTCAP